MLILQEKPAPVSKPESSSLNLLNTLSNGSSSKQKPLTDGVHRIRVDFKVKGQGLQVLLGSSSISSWGRGGLQVTVASGLPSEDSFTENCLTFRRSKCVLGHSRHTSESQSFSPADGRRAGSLKLGCPPPPGVNLQQCMSKCRTGPPRGTAQVL